MSRAAAAVSTVVLLTLALLVGGATNSSAAEDCVWTKHSKRVVKKVRRHGELRRVRRLKHWWACEPIAPAAPGPIAPAPGPTLPPLEPEPSLPRLGVKAAEWSYTLTRPDVPAGEVVVELNNMGEDPHDLNLRVEGSEAEPLQVPITPSLQQTSRRFTLPAGKYRLWCDLDGHDAKGMNASLIVTGP